MESKIPEMPIPNDQPSQCFPINSNPDLPDPGSFCPIWEFNRVRRRHSVTRIVLYAPEPKTNPCVAFVLSKCTRKTTGKPPDSGFLKKASYFLSAKNIAMMPWHTDTILCYMIVPVFCAIRSGIFVPKNRFVRMKELVTVREGTNC